MSTPTCWACGAPFRDGVVIGKAGCCAACIQGAGLTHDEAAAALPHVWGECASRLKRAAEIVSGVQAASRRNS